VTFTGGVDEAALVDLYAGACAVVFPPYDEDYGYITLEAFLARKPVVTTSDAGGPLEFVDDGVTGLVAAPDADSLGAAMSRVAQDRALARSLDDRNGIGGCPRLQRERIDRPAGLRAAGCRRLARNHRRR
jgi:glycosyltransferase involved in cell wall biosynthesis